MTERLMHVLLENQCWDLLRGEEVGRLAVVVDGRPEIFPVNYVVDHGTVVFRTAEGSKLVALATQSAVAFEIDGAEGSDAFSVIVKGRATEIAKRDELFDALDLPLYPWHLAPKHHFVRIVPEMVTGRRFFVEARRDDHADADRPRHSPPE